MKAFSSIVVVLAAACGGRTARPERPEPPAPIPSLNRTYPASFSNTWEASRSAARKLGLEILKEERDVSRGTIDTRRGDGVPLHIAVQSIDAGSTNVEVSSDRQDAEAFAAILDRIDFELRSVPPPVQGRMQPGSTLTARTFASIDRARAAARIALQRLGFVSSPERPDASELELTGRRNDGLPARILLSANSLGGTDATFIVGVEPSPANDATARQLRDEFERSLSPTGSN
jgi:hypothetical protein